MFAQTYTGRNYKNLVKLICDKSSLKCMWEREVLHHINAYIYNLRLLEKGVSCDIKQSRILDWFYAFWINFNFIKYREIERK
jgi:hypothetical protein